MYHPAAALHQPSLRRSVEEDIKRIPEFLDEIDRMDEQEPPEQAEQLSAHTSIRVAAIYGGVAMGNQEKALRQGAEIIGHPWPLA
jgi:hypothetical protein